MRLTVMAGGGEKNSILVNIVQSCHFELDAQCLFLETHDNKSSSKKAFANQRE